MTKALMISDVHGKFPDLQKIIDENQDKVIFQLGDLGVYKHTNYPHDFGKNFNFIRGNHSDPDLCYAHKNYLGDFGYIEKYDLFYKIIIRNIYFVKIRVSIAIFLIVASYIGSITIFRDIDCLFF